MAYDSATGNLTRRVDGTHGSTQKMHSTRADLQGNVVVGGFYNELLTGVAYENYDLLRTDMLRCKNVKGFNIYHPVYGTLDTCNTVSASDSDQRIQQESYAAYVQDALYLTDNWIAVAGVRYQYYTQYAGKGRPFNVNTDSRDEKWTPKAGWSTRSRRTSPCSPTSPSRLCRSRRSPAISASCRRKSPPLTKWAPNSTC